LSQHHPTHTEFFLIGKALRSHGTGGELRILVDQQLKIYIRKSTYLFFDLDGSKVPYQITDVDDGNHFVITLQDIANKKDSDVLSNNQFYIPLESVKSRHQHSPKNIRGKWDEYRILDTQHEVFYAILRVEEFPQQLMAIINIHSKEILIPLSDQLISSIDKENKIIKMEIPEGLLDL
jgi:16S rRNA processing protein RimM